MTNYTGYIIRACIMAIVVLSPIFQTFLAAEGKTYRKDYTYLKELDKFVNAIGLKRSWHEAKAHCDAEGGSLLVIRGTQEAAAIKDYLKVLPSNMQTVWVGLQNLLCEGEFKTIEGQSIDNLYHVWEDGEPSNSGGEKHCVVLNPNGKYKDVTCKSNFAFVCEKFASTINYNAECDNYDLDYKRTSIKDQCVKIHTFAKTWNEACMICKAEGAELAVINSKHEAELFVKMLKKYPRERMHGHVNKDVVLLGFHDQFTEYDFIMTNGKRLRESGYDDWAHSQPDSSDGKERCGSMNRDGKLNDIGCKVRAMFICEKKLGKEDEQTDKTEEKDKDKEVEKEDSKEGGKENAEKEVKNEGQTVGEKDKLENKDGQKEPDEAEKKTDANEDDIDISIFSRFGDN